MMRSILRAAPGPSHQRRRLPGAVRRARRQRLRRRHRHRQEHQGRHRHRPRRQEPHARHQQAQPDRRQLAHRQARPRRPPGRQGRDGPHRPHRPHRPGRPDGRSRPRGPAGCRRTPRRDRDQRLGVPDLGWGAYLTRRHRLGAHQLSRRLSHRQDGPRRRRERHPPPRACLQKHTVRHRHWLGGRVPQRSLRRGHGLRLGDLRERVVLRRLRTRRRRRDAGPRLNVIVGARPRLVMWPVRCWAPVASGAGVRSSGWWRADPWSRCRPRLGLTCVGSVARRRPRIFSVT